MPYAVKYCMWKLDGPIHYCVTCSTGRWALNIITKKVLANDTKTEETQNVHPYYSTEKNKEK